MGLWSDKTPVMAVAWAIGFAALSGLLVGGYAGTPHATASPVAPTNVAPAPIGPNAARALSEPAVAHPSQITGPPSVGIAFDNVTPPTYVPLGYQVNFTVSTTNFVDNQTNTLITLNFTALIGQASPYLTANVTYWVVPVTTVGQTNFSTTINLTNAAKGYTGWTHGVWPSDTQVVMTLAVTGFPNGTIADPALGVNSTPVHDDEPATPTTVILAAPWATLLAPSPLAGATEVSPGNTTVVIQYDAPATTGVNITIDNSAGTLAFTADLTSLSTGNVTSSATTPWLIVTTGVYTATINILTPYDGVSSFPFSFTVAKAVASSTSIVWVNSTLYSNGSTNKPLISGLSNGATGSLLLVVGVIIGMIVALVLGRMMWGGSPPATPPAQPWSASKGTNECPICHQSFASEEEMKEHEKTAHGM